MALVRDIALDAGGDWYLSGQDLAMLSGLEAIQQSVRIRLQFFKGEWFLDLLAGVPFYEQVLIKAPDVNVMRSIFATAILETPGVLALPELSLVFDRSARALTVTFRATTDLGEIQATEVL